MKSYPKYKFSGIDYLGDIPKDWHLWKFKRLTDILTCGYASTPEYVDAENGVPFLSAQNVKPGRIVLDKFNYISTELHKELTKNKQPIKNDVLIARVGGEGNIGDAAIVDLDFEFSVYVSLAHVRTRKNLLNKFLITKADLEHKNHPICSEVYSLYHDIHKPVPERQGEIDSMLVTPIQHL